jgi:hypothetical protein
MHCPCLDPLDTPLEAIKYRQIVFREFLPGSKSTRVTARLRYSRTDWLARWLLPALVLLFASGFQSAPGSTVAPAHAFDAEEHGRDCKCATRCQGASCCCGPRAGQTKLSYREPNPEPDGIGGSPCMMKPTPCGDSGLPSTPTEGPVNRNAALDALECRRLDTVGTLLPFSNCSLVPVRRVSRLDRPPELLILA